MSAFSLIAADNDVLGAAFPDNHQEMRSIAAGAAERLHRESVDQKRTVPIKVLKSRIPMISVLRFDNRMQVTTYLASVNTSESPHFLVEGQTSSSLFKVWLTEFEELYKSAREYKPPAVTSA
jgi:hypothetical protein